MSNFPATGTATGLSADTQEWGWVLLIEGYDLAFCSHDDVSGLQTAWAAASEWTVMRGGLRIPSALEYSLTPFNAEIQMPGMTFGIVDAADDITSVFEREASSAAVSEKISLLSPATVAPNSTFLLLDNSIGFPATGTVYVGTEEIPYTFNGGGGLIAGLTRGKRSLYGTSTDANHFGQAHPVDLDTGASPTVSNVPQGLIGRQVALYLSSRIGGTWTAGLQGSGATTAAECLFVGRIQTHDNDGRGNITFECSSGLEVLKGQLLSRQYRGKLQQGMYLFAAAHGYMDVHIRRTNLDNATTESFPSSSVQITNLIPSDGFYTHDEVASLINQRLLAIFNNGGGTYFDTALRLSLFRGGSTDSPGNYNFDFDDGDAGTFAYAIDIDFNSDVWTLLGWPPTTLQAHTTFYRLHRLAYTGELPVHIFAPSAPLTSAAPFANGIDPAQIQVMDVETGTEFVAQPTMPDGVPSTATGFLRIGGKYLVAVHPSSTTDDLFIIDQIVRDERMTALGIGTDDTLTSVDSPDGVTVEQVWLETGTVADLFLRLAVSTGTAGYNHSDYDDHPATMGLGIPWTMIDEFSWLEVLGNLPYLLYLTKATSFLTLLESALAVQSHYCVWRRGRVHIVSSGEDATATVSLTESNKATPDERTSVARTMDYLINAVKLRYNHNPTTDEWSEYTVNELDSQNSLKRIKTAVVDAYGFYEGVDLVGGGALDAWKSGTASQALAYFSRALAIAKRTYDLSLFASIYPGAKVLLTDSGVTNPVTGLPGVTNLPCWVVAYSQDYGTAIGRVTLAFQPASFGRTALLAPSVQVDTTALTHGWDGATKTLALAAHQYGHADDAVDVSWFPQGTKVRVVQQVVTAGETIATDTVASIDTDENRMVLTTGGFSLSAGARYVVERDDASTVTAADRAAYTFLADAFTHTTGAAAGDEYLYAGARAATGTEGTTVDYTQRFVREAPTADDQGEPFSVAKLHELADWCNTALSAHTANVLFEWTRASSFFTDVEADGDRDVGTDDAGGLVLGPVWIPLYGGTRPLRIAVYGRAVLGSATGSVRVVTSTGIVRGATTGFGPPLTYPDGGTNYTDVTLGSSYAYATEATLVPSVAPGAVPGCWLTVEGYPGSGATVVVRGLWVFEDTLS